MSPSKVTRIVRKHYREHGPDAVRAVIDAYVVDGVRAGELDPYFALALPYADPVGNMVAHCVDSGLKVEAA
ncbi:hypothetical protein ACFOYW_16860 [Gryllotalpicola reticulitermitis]|uniref:Uncharacterized protein n=2 Tax=Gryllotalpicola reticulitermitis TaxID=1184153 RepID=A0ABV8Q9Q2_9MICO